MERPATPELIELLRKTLEHLERDEELSPNDAALLELKRTILCTIADLTRMKHKAAA